jgi:transposase
MSVSEVAAVEGVSRQSVNDWKNVYEEDGMEGLEAKSNNGARTGNIVEKKPTQGMLRRGESRPLRE